MMTLSILPNDPVLVDLIASLDRIGSTGKLTNTENALSAVSGAVATKWQMEVGSKNRIQRKKLTPFTHKVFSEDKLVHWLEYGLPAYDMRQTHTKGKKSRVVKPRLGPGGKLITQWKVKNKDGSYRTVMAGSSYLIIPFRHGTKDKGTSDSAKLGDVYNDVLSQTKNNFKRSTVTKSAEGSGKVSPNYWGEQIERAEYSWGDTLQFQDEEKFKNLQGMKVMNEKGQSQFMSFRVVSVNSPASSWQHPGIKARHHLRNILEDDKEKMQAVIEAGLARDFG